MRLLIRGPCRYAERVNPCLVALTSVLLTPPLAAPPPSLDQEIVVYHDLEARTGLDLGGVWDDYKRERRVGEGFYEFTRARYRRRLGAGIGLAVAGIGLTAAGGALFAFGLNRGDDGDVDVIGGALVLTAGLALLVPGSILWPINQVRLHKLKRARSTAARLQLRAAGPVPLPRGLGLGFGLAF